MRPWRAVASPRVRVYLQGEDRELGELVALDPTAALDVRVLRPCLFSWSSPSLGLVLALTVFGFIPLACKSASSDTETTGGSSTDTSTTAVTTINLTTDSTTSAEPTTSSGTTAALTTGRRSDCRRYGWHRGCWVAKRQPRHGGAM